MSEQIRVGVIGVGNMGRHHIRNYSEMPDTKLVAMADPNQSTAELAERYNASYYAEYTEMLDAHQLDAVSVTVPTPLHHKIAKDTISRGIPTLVEKPIASSVAEGQELIDLAEEKEVVLSVGHVERYNPVVERLKQMIDSGQLGQILSIETRRVGGFPAIEPKTDVIMDLAIHDIDILNYLMSSKGEVREVNGHRTNHSLEIDSTEIFLDYGGVSGIILANWITPVKIREVIITGSKGYLQANYITQEITLYEKMDIVQKDSFEGFVEAFGEPEEHIIRLAKKEPLHRQLSAFVLAAANGNRQELISPREALSALDIAIDAATRLKERKTTLYD
ncbi:MAG TPA: Gfo/Idh/MocA family oxidoreductase [Candidatus Saccharimonadales bacterium]|nr:Gfo/Idh/MocA family oxidoreductase [Candidatus Saccharimonadales bacterium]